MPKGSRRRVYVGRLDRRTRARDLEDVFNRYGRIRDLELKRDYAFIEYYEPRDAEDAIHDMDGRKLDGSRIIVEWAGSRGNDRGSVNEDTCFNCGQTGHWWFLCRANNCKEGDWKDKCYRCGKKGHMKRDCPASKSRSRSRERSRRSPRERDSHKYRDDKKRNREESGERNREEQRDRSRDQSPTPEKKKSASPVLEEYES